MSALSLDETDDGYVVLRLDTDHPPSPRVIHLEPNLLPQIARLCPESSIGEVLGVGEMFGKRWFSPWYQLRQLVRYCLISRFSDEQLLRAERPSMTRIELKVRRAVLDQRSLDEGLWKEIDQVDETDMRRELTALGCTLDPSGQRHRLQGLVDVLDPGNDDIETVRLVATAQRLTSGKPFPGDLAEAWTQHGALDPFRAAHLLYLVKESDRPELLAEIQERLDEVGAPRWAVAFFASRSASVAPGAIAWDTGYYGDSDEVWAAFVRDLSAMGPTTADGDTYRAHPSASVLEQVSGPQEGVAGAAYEMVSMFAVGSEPPPPETAEPEPPPPRMVESERVEGAREPERVESSRPRPVEASEPVSAAPDTVAASDDRRLGVDVFASGRELKRALVRDVAQVFEVSIGHGARFQVATPTRVAFAPGVEMRRLSVRMVGDGFDETEFMTLQRDPAKQGSTSFQVTPQGTSFSAMVIVYNEDRSLVIQAGHLTADVVESIDAEATAESSIEFVVLPAAPLAVDRPGAATVVTAGDRLAVTSEAIEVAAAVTGVLGEVDRLVRSLQSAAGDVALLGVESPSFAQALRGAARAGARLHSKLELGALDGADRVQVVSVTGETVLPLELVYDGPAPENDAPLCEDWQGSMRNGSCTSCDRRVGGDRAKVVCPLRFWACSKVIEHHHGASVGQTEFAVRVMTDATSVSIPRPTAAIVGASQKVTEALAAGLERSDPFDELLRGLGKFGEAAQASDWREWTSAVASTGASLLIAMPHQETISDNGVETGALELGGMFETTFGERFFSSGEGETSAPVLLLLGCNTAIEAQTITSFASWFRQWSSVVVATIGEVMAHEAPSVAATILDQFNDAWNDANGNTIGEAMRETRRVLLADGRLVGLQLVLHGEASWHIGL